MKLDISEHAGRRIEVEIDGQRVRGRVMRGADRRAIFMEERGPVGTARSDTHKNLHMLRTWSARQLEDAILVAVLPAAEVAAKPRRRCCSEWSETVKVAEGDPANPPREWDGGMLAWAELVYAARRQVERSRKNMLKALREAAG
jgi:hypothetical protein